MRQLGHEDDQRGGDRIRGRLRQDLRRPNGEERAIAEEAMLYGLLDLGQWSGLVRRGQWPARDEPLDIALDRRTGDEHAVLAGRAAQADVRAEPDDAPCVAPAWMRLAQRDDIVEIERKRPRGLADAGGPRGVKSPGGRLGHSRESSREAQRSGVARAGRSSADSLVTSNRVPL